MFHCFFCLLCVYTHGVYLFAFWVFACALWICLHVLDCLPPGSDLYLHLHNVEFLSFFLLLFGYTDSNLESAYGFTNLTEHFPPRPRHYTHYFN